jgi:hypothetical protein
MRRWIRAKTPGPGTLPPPPLFTKLLLEFWTLGVWWFGCYITALEGQLRFEVIEVDFNGVAIHLFTAQADFCSENTNEIGLYLSCWQLLFTLPCKQLKWEKVHCMVMQVSCSFHVTAWPHFCLHEWALTEQIKIVTLGLAMYYKWSLKHQWCTLLITDWNLEVNNTAKQFVCTGSCLFKLLPIVLA